MNCCCQKAGTIACLSCSIYREHFGDSRVNYYIPEMPKIDPDKLRIKRTIEKYDEKGNIIERIIEE